VCLLERRLRSYDEGIFPCSKEIPMRTDPHADICLAAGETLHLPVAAGTVLRLAQGRAQIDEAPRWLAERLVAVGHAVEQEQTYVVEQAGCVTVLGAAGARLQALPAAVPVRRTAPWWPRLGWWRSA
jgi:hypothetical protein